MSATRVEHFRTAEGNVGHRIDLWRSGHEHDGFFLDLRGTSTARLHRASCQESRMGEHEHMAEGCVCSTDRHALRQWAEESGRDVEVCDCV